MNEEILDPEEVKEAGAVERAAVRGGTYQLPDGTPLRFAYAQLATAQRAGLDLAVLGRIGL